jgi:hypothetical protein
MKFKRVMNLGLKISMGLAATFALAACGRGFQANHATELGSAATPGPAPAPDPDPAPTPTPSPTQPPTQLPPPSPFPADLQNLKPGEWYQVPNSHLEAVFPNPSAPGSPGSVMAAWSGGAVDTKRNRLFVWGGGHGDYGGNELYIFDLASLAWARTWGPTADIPPAGYQVETYPDGNPASRHTYDGLAYLPTQDKFWTAGGSLWSGSGAGSAGTWTFDPVAFNWERRAQCPYYGVSVFSDYDPVSKKIYHGSDKGLLAEYDPATDIWTTKAEINGLPLGEEAVGAIDPVARVFVILGNGTLMTYHLETGVVQVRTTQGPQNVVNTRGPGLLYDPVLKKIVGFAGGSSVYSLDVATWTWEEHPAKTAAVPDGNPDRLIAYGRFNYFPSQNLYVWVNATNQNVWLYKLTP